jgi:hypothetical protein
MKKLVVLLFLLVTASAWSIEFHNDSDQVLSLYWSSKYQTGPRKTLPRGVSIIDMADIIKGSIYNKKTGVLMLSASLGIKGQETKCATINLKSSDLNLPQYAQDMNATLKVTFNKSKDNELECTIVSPMEN